nr:hypothetical protein [Streptomyces sp. NRRL F-2305]
MLVVAVGEEEGRAGVGEDERAPLLGLAGVEGDVAAAGLEDGEGGDDVVEGAVLEEADGVSRAHAPGP